VVIAIIAILAAMLLPALAAARAKSQRIVCASNLKQVAIAFKLWSGNHHDFYPMGVPAVQGGAQEAVGTGASATWDGSVTPNPNYNPSTFTNAAPACYGVFAMFRVMSNELNTPKILSCPSEGFDPLFIQATAWGVTNSFANDYNVSYFVGVDARESTSGLKLNTRMFLAGDRTMGFCSSGNIPPAQVPAAPITGIFGGAQTTTFCQPLGLSAADATAWVGWANGIGHVMVGNVAMMDGSVQAFNRATLQAALANTGDNISHPATTGTPGMPAGNNRLQFPY
jgi:type II secretory pathway pseudopilin PulG